MKRTLELLVTLSVLLYYNFVMWYGHVFELSQTVSLGYMKPYVYRQLVPYLIRGLEREGIRVDIATIIITTIAGIGFYLSLSALMKNIPIYPMVFFIVSLFLFVVWHKIYDFMTAWLWTMLFIKLLNRDYRWFSVLFILICFNRIETALFVVPVYCLQEKNWKFSSAMLSLSVVLFLFLRLYFSDNVGSSALIEPIQNLQRLASNWQTTLIHLFIFGTPFYLALQQKHPIHSYYVVLFPVFVVLYLIFGQAFEVRVFWEVYPLLTFIFTRSLILSSKQALNFAT